MKGVTDLLLLDHCIFSFFLSVLVPGDDFLDVELFEVAIVQESLVDCGGFADTFRSLVSLISLSEEQFCMDFKGKSVLLEAW